tara:strand:- start:29 stop:187 length:159 start_codon:yes stop_codon:yes gene_type:complete
MMWKGKLTDESSNASITVYGETKKEVIDRFYRIVTNINTDGLKFKFELYESS